VEANNAQQHQAHWPEQFDIGLEQMAVAIDRFLSQKNLEVADKVANDKQHHNDARGSHDIFLAERRTK
jgi:hypothetical protein